MKTRLLMLAASLPLLLPGGFVVTMCLEDGTLGLRGMVGETCRCRTSTSDAPACCRCCALDAPAEKTPRDPCCVELVAVGEHPVKGDGLVRLELEPPTPAPAPTAVAAEPAMTPAPAVAPANGEPPRFVAPLLI